MPEEKISCLNPVPGKTGKNISKAKYDITKAALIQILSASTPTHTELFETLEKNLTGKFDGNISWYGECVKLDLEARKIIERDSAKPPRYHLV
jgi:hypothetical protein